MKLRNPKHEAAAWSLARNPVQAAAARDAGVDRASITKWLKDASFSARVDELRMQRALAEENARAAPGNEDEASEVAERGLAHLVPIAIEVVAAALKGEEYNGHPVSTQQHAQALRTIELARKLEPKAIGFAGAPSLGDLIAEADARRVGSD